tara:strand:- start:2836 stop:3090 length:255 start_codon:yes stop_codon:yes gene_type:complete
MVDSVLLKLQVLNEEEKLNSNLELLEESIEKLYVQGVISSSKSEYLKDFVNKLVNQEMDFLLSEPEEYFDLYTEDDDIYDASDL